MQEAANLQATATAARVDFRERCYASAIALLTEQPHLSVPHVAQDFGIDSAVLGARLYLQRRAKRGA